MGILKQKGIQPRKKDQMRATLELDIFKSLEYMLGFRINLLSVISTRAQHHVFEVGNVRRWVTLIIVPTALIQFPEDLQQVGQNLAGK